jgi:predicted dehydrogenase
VLVENEEVEVAYMCELDSEHLARLSRRYPSVTPTTRFEDLLEDADLDAVVISTPVFTHHEFASRSLEAGKHTFVEKPLTPSAEQADELIALAGRNGVVLRCGHTPLYSPSVVAIKQLIDDGQLGEIYFISSSRVNLGLHQRDVSVVWDLGPHDFSILLHWLGERPEAVRASGRDSIVKGVVDVAFVTLRFPSGIVAQVELSWLSPSKLRRTVVVGSRRMAVYEDGAHEPIRLFDHGVVYSDPETYGEYQLSYRTGDIVSPKIETYEPLSAELADFRRAALAAEEMPDNAALARDVVAIAEAASRSLDAGGAEVRVERSVPVEALGRHDAPAEAAPSATGAEAA